MKTKNTSVSQIEEKVKLPHPPGPGAIEIIAGILSKSFHELTLVAVALFLAGTLLHVKKAGPSVSTSGSDGTQPQKASVLGHSFN